MRTSSGRYSVVLIRTIEKSYPILSITYQGEGDRRHNGQMHACPKNCRDGGSDPARAEGQGRLSKRFLRFAHPWWDLRIGMRCFSNPRRRDSFRDRNCRMGPLLRLSFSDRFPRILQLPAFGNPARSGGSQNTPINLLNSVSRGVGDWMRRKPCVICEEQIEISSGSRPWKHPHYKSVHPDYSRWIRHWMRVFFAFDFVIIVALVTADYLWFRYGLWYLAVSATLLLIFFVYYGLWIWRRGLLRFHHEWKEQHPRPINNRG